MPQSDDDDRRVGSQGYMLLSEFKDLGAGALPFLTPPKDRDPGQLNQPTDPVFIPIRGWASRVDRRTSDVTCSAHYGAADDTVYSAGLPTATSMEVRVDGVFRMDTIPGTLMAALYDGAALSHVVLAFDDTHKYCEGDFTVSNFMAMTPIDGAITYSAVLKSYGVYNPYPNKA